MDKYAYVNKVVHVWYDELAHGAPWCVSICEEDGGGEIKFLAAYRNREKAIEHGRDEADERGLDCEVLDRYTQRVVERY